MTSPPPSAFVCILRQVCPRCRSGAVFGGLIRMHHTCPQCGVAFEREPGYFLGAMYMSYALALIVVTPVALALFFLAHWSVEATGWVSGSLLLVLSPWLFRYSRVLWIYFDDLFDPV